MLLEWVFRLGFGAVIRSECAKRRLGVPSRWTRLELFRPRRLEAKVARGHRRSYSSNDDDDDDRIHIHTILE